MDVQDTPVRRAPGDSTIAVAEQNSRGVLPAAESKGPVRGIPAVLETFSPSSRRAGPGGFGRGDFIQGIYTVGGQGDATCKEGIAVHVYACSRCMTNRAFANNDGDLLILPQTGRLRIQTEMGWMMVRPGELVVIQAGIRFRVLLPDGPSRGYVQEIFGTHYELPELGPLGSNGMALPRDFESPLASFDIDSSPWEVVYKTAGALQTCHQRHTPFDVVAWHGNLVPYKYAIEKFVNVANVERDQADPTVYCVLTAKSKHHKASLTDLLALHAKMDSHIGCVSAALLPPQYVDRNHGAAVRRIQWKLASSRARRAGYEPAYMPHGETYRTWRDATTRPLRPERVCEDTIAFMFHIGVPLLLTEWARLGKGDWPTQGSPPESWDDLKAHFLDHLDEVNDDLKKAGRSPLRKIDNSTTRADGEY